MLIGVEDIFVGVINVVIIVDIFVTFVLCFLLLFLSTLISLGNFLFTRHRALIYNFYILSQLFNNYS